MIGHSQCRLGPRAGRSALTAPKQCLHALDLGPCFGEWGCRGADAWCLGEIVTPYVGFSMMRGGIEYGHALVVVLCLSVVVDVPYNGWWLCPDCRGPGSDSSMCCRSCPAGGVVEPHDGRCC